MRVSRIDTRLLAAAFVHTAATNSWQWVRHDTSRRWRSSDWGRPVSVSKPSPLLAAAFSWALNDSASSIDTKGCPNRLPSTVQRTRQRTDGPARVSIRQKRTL